MAQAPQNDDKTEQRKPLSAQVRATACVVGGAGEATLPPTAAPQRPPLRLTDENEGDGDDEGEDVAADRLVVLAVAHGEHLHLGVDVVLAQRLREGGGSGKDKLK